jgi:hypothetical protein
VSCFTKKKCASIISDLIVGYIKKKGAEKEKKSCERRVERSICLSAQVLNFYSSTEPDCYPSFGAKFCLGLIATLAS